ncbi:MAG: rhodanese-like domain-containing protein [Methanoregula sp.]|nr:rhodanese-like domain-containing protein [Methanoregula sp.]
MMKKYLVILLLILLALIVSAGCTQNTAPAAGSMTPVVTPSVMATGTPASMIPMTTAGKYTDLTPAQAKDLIASEKDLVIVDVSPYYADGHLPGAISIPLATLDAKIPTLDKTKTYLVYCHGDGPSISGAQKLVDAGFMKVYRLAGNYAAWTAAGYPVST